MPRIVRAEFLSYYNSRRNSDKLFNVFVIEDDDGTFRAVSEYGRRGTNLVRDTLCTRATRDFAKANCGRNSPPNAITAKRLTRTSRSATITAKSPANTITATANGQRAK